MTVIRQGGSWTLYPPELLEAMISSGSPQGVARQGQFKILEKAAEIFEPEISMPASGEKVRHDDLFQGILEALQEWPNLDQQIFIQAHYRGQSIEKISRSFNLDMEEVRLILQHRDRELYAALRRFREAGCGESSPSVIQPADPAARRLVISGCNF